MKTIEFAEAFRFADHAVINNAHPLVQTYALRMLIEACEQRITELSDDAVKAALAILNGQGKTQGQFTTQGEYPLTFQLQRTDIYDLSNYSRYKGEDAVRWRQKKTYAENSRKYVHALTTEMRAIVDAFVATHPDWEPDETRITLKCIKDK